MSNNLYYGDSHTFTSRNHTEEGSTNVYLKAGYNENLIVCGTLEGESGGGSANLITLDGEVSKLGTDSSQTVSREIASYEEGLSVAIQGNDCFVGNDGGSLVYYTNTSDVWSYIASYDFTSCSIGSIKCIALSNDFVVAGHENGAMAAIKVAGTWAQADYGGSSRFPCSGDLLACYSDGTNYTACAIDGFSTVELKLLKTTSGNAFPSTPTRITIANDARQLRMNSQNIFIAYSDKVDVCDFNGSVLYSLEGIAGSVDYGKSIDCNESTLIVADSANCYIYEYFDGSLRLISVFPAPIGTGDVAPFLDSVAIDRNNAFICLNNQRSVGLDSQTYLKKTGSNWLLQSAVTVHKGGSNYQIAIDGEWMAYGSPTANSDEGSVIFQKFSNSTVTETLSQIVISSDGIEQKQASRPITNTSFSGLSGSKTSGAFQIESIGTASIYSDIATINTMKNTTLNTGTVTASGSITSVNPYILLTQSGTQSLSAATQTIITVYDTVIDTGGLNPPSHSSGVLTINEAGTYMVWASLTFDYDGTGNAMRSMHFTKNSATDNSGNRYGYVAQNALTTDLDRIGLSSSTVLQFDDDDTIAVSTYSSRAVSTNGAIYGHFGAVKLF